MTFQPVRGPADLRRLEEGDLSLLAEEIRQTIISVCLKNGGHLGASLGTVELAIALHREFESPREPILWDVGHQAYAHKLLTGRWARFASLRQTGGLSGFLNRDESEHDIFGAGHSSTILSAALGIAWKKKSDQWTVAVVGDGGLTAGLAFEALNNFKSVAGGPLLVVLNDNQMSISANVGAISRVLTGDVERKAYFSHFGFEYLGPIDGHDIQSLSLALREIRRKTWDRPVLLHVLTQKGKGYAPAEESPAHYHGVGPLAAGQKKTYSEEFGAVICDLAEGDPRVVAITAAMPDGTGLLDFAKRFPGRFFDVGIAEAHSVTFAAGLATQGLRPIVAVYSTFLQRALDSIIHDVALQRLPVVFAIDRAGIVGSDGPTHHGVFDLAFLSMIPEIQIYAASSPADLKSLFKRALKNSGPTAIRYPRGSGPALEPTLSEDGVRWHQKASAPKIIVIALGATANRAASAVTELDPKAQRITLASTVRVKPVSPEILAYLEQQNDARVLVIEDGVVSGGFGSNLVRSLRGHRRVECAGYGDHFIGHGSSQDLEESEGVSKSKIVMRMNRILESN